MKARHLSIAALAAFALSGCVTYDTVGARAPGGYYSGRASTEYYYGGYGYGGYGYYPYGYGGYYGSYGYPYPYYRPYYSYPNHHPRPPHRPGGDDHGGHGNHDGDSGGRDRDENRVPPWRRPGNLVDDAQRRDRPIRPQNEERFNPRQGSRQGTASSQRPVPQRMQPAPQPRPMPRATDGESRSRPMPATGRGQYRGRVRSDDVER